MARRNGQKDGELTAQQIRFGVPPSPWTNYVPDAITIGHTAALDKEVDLYIQGDVVQDGGTYTAAHGNNSWSGETSSRPFLNFDGIRKIAGSGAAAGIRFHVHFMGDGGDAVNAPAVGRWLYDEFGFDFPGQIRSYKSNWRFSGPRDRCLSNTTERYQARHANLVGYTADTAFPSQSGVAERVRLQFDAGMDYDGAFLCARRSDGRKVFKDLPIVRTYSSGSTHYVWVDGISLSTGQLDNILSHGSVTWASSAASAIIIEGPGGAMDAGAEIAFNGRCWTGDVAFQLQGRLGTSGNANLDLDSNPYPTFRDLWFPRNTFMLRGSAAFDGCRLDDHATLGGPCSYRFYNCVANQVFDYRGLPAYLDESSAGSVDRDPCGEMDITQDNWWLGPGWGVTDPELPTVGIDLLVTAGGNIQIGRIPQAGNGVLGIVKGLVSFQNDPAGYGSGIGIKCVGPASGLWLHELAICRLEMPSSPIAGIWAQMGAQVRINQYAQYWANDSDTAHALRVGKGAAISLADFRNAAIWKGNFTRATEIDGTTMRATDDHSRIWTETWEPDYAYESSGAMSSYGSVRY